jgi:hypothetical protein
MSLLTFVKFKRCTRPCWPGFVLGSVKSPPACFHACTRADTHFVDRYMLTLQWAFLEGFMAIPGKKHKFVIIYKASTTLSPTARIAECTQAHAMAAGKMICALAPSSSSIIAAARGKYVDFSLAWRHATWPISRPRMPASSLSEWRRSGHSSRPGDATD